MMYETLAVIGRDPFVAEPTWLPVSDRGAVGLARLHWKSEAEVRVSEPDPLASAYAQAAGLRGGPLENGASCEARWILLGRGACGREGDFFAARLADKNQAALVYEVVDLEREGAKLRVVRDLGYGNFDELLVASPAVLVVAESVRRVGYVSANRIARGKEGFSQEYVPREMGSWSRTVPRPRLGEHAQRTEGTATERMNRLVGIDEIETPKVSNMIEEDVAECAEYMIRYLSHHGFIGGQGGKGNAAAKSDWMGPEGPAESIDSDSTRGVRLPPQSRDFREPGSMTDAALSRGPRRTGAPRPTIRGPFTREVGPSS